MRLRTGVVLFLTFEALLNFFSAFIVFGNPQMLLRSVGVSEDGNGGHLVKMLHDQPATLFFVHSYGVFTLAIGLFLVALLLGGDPSTVRTSLALTLIADVAYIAVTTMHFLEHVPQPWPINGWILVLLNFFFFFGRLLCLAVGVASDSKVKTKKQ